MADRVDGMPTSYGSVWGMSNSESPKREPEFSGPIWKHPYFIYIWLTAGIFAFLSTIAYVAYVNDWIPKR